MTGEVKKKIFKYQLEVTDSQFVSMPQGSKIISVEEQSDKVVIYAIVRPLGQREEKHEIKILGTGHPVSFDENEYSFVGTVKLAGGELMFHVFERLIV